MSYLTVQDVREYVEDRDLEDNPLGLDLTWTDEEILRAMKGAAREWNSIPPYILGVRSNELPEDTNLFLEATVEQLLKSRLSALRRQDLDYSAGGVGVNLVQKQIAHFEREIQERRGNWEPRCREMKVHANLAQAYGTF